MKRNKSIKLPSRLSAIVYLLLLVVLLSIHPNTEWDSKVHATGFFSYGARLWSVWGSSETDIYAVGDSGLVIHFDGKLWERIPPSSIYHSLDNYILNSVWGTSKNDVIISGRDSNGRKIYLQYDGTTWKKIDNNQSFLKQKFQKDFHFDGKWAVSGSKIYSVNNTGYITCYGDSSTKVTKIRTEKKMYDIWGTSGTNIYAAGENGVVLRFDGKAWKKIRVDPDHNHICGIWGSSASNVYFAQ